MPATGKATRVRRSSNPNSEHLPAPLPRARTSAYARHCRSAGFARRSFFPESLFTWGVSAHNDVVIDHLPGRPHFRYLGTFQVWRVQRFFR